MSTAAEPIDPGAATGRERNPQNDQQVCPFCGTVNNRSQGACPRCNMQNTVATRRATRERIGPWYVMQKRNPAAPGMKFETLLALVRKGKVTPRSVVRGPTTDQLWRFAAQVKGLSREFGLCYGCGSEIDGTGNMCPHCKRLQDPPINPDVLLESGPAVAEKPPQKPQEAAHATPAPAPRPRRSAQPGPAEAPRPASRQATDEPAGPPRQTNEAPRTERPRTRASESSEEILSARELAAAFRLDYVPPATPRRRIVRGFLKAVAVLLLFAVAGLAVVFYLDPDLRHQTRALATGIYDSARATVSGWMDRPAPAQEEQWPEWTAPEPSAEPRSDSEIETTAPEVEPAPEAAPPASPESAAAEPAPHESEPSAPATADEAEQDRTDPEPVSADQLEEEIQPSPPALAPKPLDPEEALAEARRLWRLALDAEARRDFEEATRLYEQIKQLPPTVWPLGLDLRLENARRRAGE